MSVSWDPAELTEEEAARQGRYVVRIAAVLTGLALLLLATAVVVGVLTASRADAAGVVTVGKGEYGWGQIRYGGKGPEAWRWELLQERRRSAMLQSRLTVRVLEARSLRRTLAHDPSVTEALNLAATVYGHGPTLWRKAECESHLRATAKNRTSSAAGLLQFLDSTWASTPFAGFSVYSPYANALAGGWMHDVGRGGEWVCR